MPSSKRTNHPDHHHPNSIAAAAVHNPALKKMIDRGRRTLADDIQSMNKWAAAGFGPAHTADPRG
jgi:LmbE family N-acetylglucosaminyl deacetylase